EAIYKFIEKKTTENENGIYLRLSWFGGEPLLAKDKIIDFMNKLESLKSKHPVEIHASLITNGYLLTPSLFEKLVDCGITTYQVTLDGNADTHDTLRTLRDGSPTFDVIYNNLKGIKELTHPDSEFSFSVRANFLRNNVDSMKRLLDRFMTDFSEDKRFSIYFRPVYNFETTRDDIDPLTPDICTTSEGLHIQNELTFKSMSINTENTKLSKVTDPLPKPTYSWCPSIRANAYIIGADGAIFSCDTLMIDKKDSVGEITPEGDINFNSNAKLWKNTIFEEGNEIIKECTECKLLPICMGGCRRSRLISGQKPCFWTVEDIERSMKEYSKLSQANTNEP
ncbi:MAG: radical SAM protein, partial [Bacillota bacterium]